MMTQKLLMRLIQDLKSILTDTHFNYVIANLEEIYTKTSNSTEESGTNIVPIKRMAITVHSTCLFVNPIA